MPRVPTYEANQVRLRSSETGPMVAEDRDTSREIAGAYGAAANALSAVAQVAQQEVERRAETTAREVDVELSAQHRDLLWGKDGLLNRKGDDFLNNVEATTKQLDQLSKSYSARGRTAQEKRMIADVIQRRNEPALTGIARYQAQATQDVWRGRTSAKVENDISNMVAAYADDAAWKDNRLQLDTALLDKSEAFGWTPDEYKMHKAEAYAKAHVYGIANLLESDDTEAAEKRYEQALSLGELTPEATSRLRSAINQTKNNIAADTFAMEVETLGKLPLEGVDFGQPLADLPEPSSTYGPRKHPIDGVVKNHTGIDYAAPEGTPILATAPGKVVEVGNRGGYGTMVRVDHGGGTETWYAHMSDAGVKVGDTVKKGQRLGAVGQTGKATGPHLHYEVRLGGRATDPSASRTVELTHENLQAVARERSGGDPRLYKSFMQAGSAAISRREAVKREQRENLVDAVWQYAEKATNENQIPKGLWNSLKPQDRDAFRGQIKANATGDDTETSISHYGDLMTMMSDNPKAFARYEFETDTKLSKQDRRWFIGQRTELRAGTTAPKRKASLEATNRVAGIVMPQDMKDEDQSAFKGALYRAVSLAESAAEKPLDETQIMDMASKLLVETRLSGKGTLGKQAPLYKLSPGARGPDIVNYQDIPDPIRQRLVRDYRAANGNRMPTKSEIASAYVSLKSRGLVQ